MKHFNIDDSNFNIDGKKMDVELLISGELSNIFEELEKMSKLNDETDEKKCPNCDTTLKEITNSLSVGCSVCYKTFKVEIIKLLKKRNLIPKFQIKKSDVEDIRKQIDIAIRMENYELAQELKERLEGNDNVCDGI